MPNILFYIILIGFTACALGYVILNVKRSPRQDTNFYPHRPMDNRERRALWSSKYYIMYEPFGHPTKIEVDTTI